MDKKLFDCINDAIDDRKPWETRQSTWYRMRHRGLPRINKPYPGAPNLHFPLADSLIEKLKPFYVQQLYGNDTIASFISLVDQAAEQTSMANYWFDYKLKQESNFEREINIVIDNMLQGGFGILKIFWDEDVRRICFDACDPLHIIVPEWTEELQCADWLVHVLHYSEAQYHEKERWVQDDDFISRIKGRGDSTSQSGEREKLAATQAREGIQIGEDDEQIVIWEVYCKSDQYGSSKGWSVETISPILGCDEPVAPCFGLPFRHNKLPFVKFRTEIKDKGWYSPRGITEIVAPFESSLCKMWNGKHQWMDFHNNPTFTSDQPIPNANSYRARPGSLLPAGVKPVFPPPLPSSFDEEMNNTRALAEYRVAMPDFGVVAPTSGPRAGGKRTATEINAIVGQTGQGSDIRARIFRMDMGDALKMAYWVLMQYDKSGLIFISNGDPQKLDPRALHNNYEITPNGSPDSWNKGAQLQKAVATLQMIAGSPMQAYVKWGEALRWLFEKDDPRDIKRLVEDPADQTQDQAYIQQDEIVHILNNFAVPIKQSDDDKTHCAVGQQFFMGRVNEQNPVTPEQANAFLQHFGAHLQALAQKGDPAHNQVQKMMAPYMDILQQLAQAMPSNVLPMGQPDSNAMPASGPTTTQEQAAPPPSLPEQASNQISDGATIANALATLIKAGVPINHAEINHALADMGCPPLDYNADPEQQAVPPQPLPPPSVTPQEEEITFERGEDGKIAKAHRRVKVG